MVRFSGLRLSDDDRRALGELQRGSKTMTARQWRRIATSYDEGRTKTNRVRRMPVHVVLAATLADWKLNGWQAMMGRSPTADDLIVPMPKSARVLLGKMRTKNDSHKRLRADLKTLGLRHRRGQICAAQ